MFRNATLARAGILLACVYVYFVLFPADLTAVLGPASQVLNLSTAVSPWLYLVVAVAIAARAVKRIWGRA
jgi:hypothetical protein